jgi:excisionase family DNA binding protein
MLGTVELLTTREAAAILRMRPDSIIRIIKRGELVGRKVGKQWLVRRSDVEALVALPEPQG